MIRIYLNDDNAKSWDVVFKMAENSLCVFNSRLDAHTLNTDKTIFLTYQISNKLLPLQLSLKL